MRGRGRPRKLPFEVRFRGFGGIANLRVTFLPAASNLPLSRSFRFMAIERMRGGACLPKNVRFQGFGVSLAKVILAPLADAWI